MTPADILQQPFAQWPQPLRAAYLEGWSVVKIGTGKSERDTIAAGGPGVAGIVLGAAWNIGATEAREQRSP